MSKGKLMNWYKTAKHVISAYHGSNDIFDSFDNEFAAQGVFWFSTDLNKIKDGHSGANSSKYIYTVELNVDKIAGWEKYDAWYLEQIKDAGFDSIKLDDDWVVFSPDRIKIKSISKRQEDGSYENI